MIQLFQFHSLFEKIYTSFTGSDKNVYIFNVIYSHLGATELVHMLF